MDSIKDRLAHIIRAKNLSATQFAEMMQIQPSNVSHLLSGRNKPSLDFLIKLKDIFPEYSFDWIILGKKPITISERSILVDKSETLGSLDIIEPENKVLNIDSTFIDVDRREMIDENDPDNEKINFISKKVRQIIYVYDDQSFEIFENRK